MPNYIDKDEPAKQLERFKQALQKRHTWKTFTTPDNLAKNVLADLGREVRNLQLKPIDPSGLDSTAAKPWTNERSVRYTACRYTTIVHVIEPSSNPDQK